ncbi:hypothetical protein PCE1_000737 [Barthelona sp. PCE]
MSAHINEQDHVPEDFSNDLMSFLTKYVRPGFSHRLEIFLKILLGFVVVMLFFYRLMFPPELRIAADIMFGISIVLMVAVFLFARLYRKSIHIDHSFDEIKEKKE